MPSPIIHGFKYELVSLLVSELKLTKNLSATIKQGRKYRQILSSIREVGLIEPPVVSPGKRDEGYHLLDGHLRVMALKELGVAMVSCLVSTDDEAYTYNKRINSLSAVQAHRMLLKAINSGVSEEKLANALNIDIKTLRDKKYMLAGICPEAVNLLKDKTITENVFRVLKKMKPGRQIISATLMSDNDRCSYLYAKMLLDATPDDQLVEGKNSRRTSSNDFERQARLEKENISLSENVNALKASYGDDLVNFTALQAYMKCIMNNRTVADYLMKHHEEIHKKFLDIIKIDYLKMESVE